MSISTSAVSTTIGNVYVSSGNTAVTALTLCNYSPGNVSINLYIVPGNATPSTTNIVLANLFLTSEDTYELYQASEKFIFGNGDYIAANATANSSVSVVVSSTSL